METTAYLDYHLKSIVPIVSHILENSRDIITSTKDLNKILEKRMLVSFDIVPFYPNISHEEGLKIKQYQHKDR